MNPFDTPPTTQLFAPRGALFVTRGLKPSGWSVKKWLGYAMAAGIRWAERTKDESVSWANHAGIVIKGGYLTHPPEGLKAVVSESQWHVNEHPWWDDHKGDNVAIAVFKIRNLSTLQERQIVEDAHSREGDRYAWWRLFTFLGERLTRKPLSSAHILKERNVCSNHAGLAWEAAGYQWPEPPGQLDPDDILDHCMANPERVEFCGWALVSGGSA